MGADQWETCPICGKRSAAVYIEVDVTNALEVNVRAQCSRRHGGCGSIASVVAEAAFVGAP